MVYWDSISTLLAKRFHSNLFSAARAFYTELVVWNFDQSGSISASLCKYLLRAKQPIQQEQQDNNNPITIPAAFTIKNP